MFKGNKKGKAGKMENKNDIRVQKREKVGERERRLRRRIEEQTTGCTMISAVKTRGRTEPSFTRCV